MQGDDFKGLREALAAGPTSGPWTVHTDSDDGWPLVMAGGPSGRIVANVNPESCPDESSAPAFVVMPSDANARHIAAANPATIAALLAELDRTREERDALREDAERIEHLESLVQRGRLEIARSLLGAGYEFGHWPKTGPRAVVHTGSLRQAIDSVRGNGKEAGNG